jgi:hypothetical protein
MLEVPVIEAGLKVAALIAAVPARAEPASQAAAEELAIEGCGGADEGDEGG